MTIAPGPGDGTPGSGPRSRFASEFQAESSLSQIQKHDAAPSSRPAGGIGDAPPDSPAPSLPSEVSVTRTHENVVFIFLDVVGYTQLAATMDATEVVNALNTLYLEYDSLCEQSHVLKLDIVADCYVLCSPLFEDHKTDIERRMLGVAARLIQITNDVARQTKIPWRIRVGMHIGPCASSVLGRIRKKFSVLGDALNLAR